MCQRLGFVLAAAACLFAPARATARLNVLLLVADDLNNRLGCYGDPLVRTPHIDRLAARGVRFDRAYCAFPLCGPSRNALLTGLYPNASGVLANGQIFRQTVPDRLSLPQTFRRHGYFAARVGKLYHYNVPNSIGTDGHDDPASWELQLNPAGVDRTEEHPAIFSLVPGQFGGVLSWHASPHDASRHTDGLLAEDAQWVLERCARRPDRPFFLAVGFFRPHTPFVAPKTPWFDQYDPAAMPVIEDAEQDRHDLPPAALASRKPEQQAMTRQRQREALQAYYACVSFMDAQVGRVIDALERYGLADDTVVVFTSDHGYHLGEHGLWQKMSLFEESCRVPLLVVAPGAAGGGRCADPVSHVDLFPTLAELCGVAPPAGLQGQSLVPLLRNPQATGRSWAVTQVTRGAGRSAAPRQPDAPPERFFGYSLRTSRWRYTEWDEGRQGRELYDHAEDPREQHNLAAEPAFQATVAGLAEQLQACFRGGYPTAEQTPPLQPGVWAPQFVDP